MLSLVSDETSKSGGLDGFFPARRCQRRALHQIAQRIDDGLCADPYLSDRLRVENAALAPSCRQRSGQIKEELLRRFLSRNAGFCGTANAANSDLVDAGLVDGKNSYGTTAAAHYVAVYWTQAATDLKAAMKTKALQDGAVRFPSLAVYHDASDVCGKEVPYVCKSNSNSIIKQVTVLQLHFQIKS